LAILDVKMPRMDGMEVLRRLRRSSDLPVIILTSKDEEIDEILGFNLGADDYIHKPFSQRLLIERVKAVLRRAGGGPGEQKLAYHDIVLDTETRDVWRAGRLIELTPTEYRLLHYLLANARRVLTREQILEAVWDYTFAGNASVLETYVSYLRQKIDAGETPLIQTVRGVGYSLRLAPGAESAG